MASPINALQPRTFRVGILGPWTAGPIGARFAVVGQVADRPLLAMSQLGLGGSVYGRAYDFSERSGDQGLWVGSRPAALRLYGPKADGPLTVISAGEAPNRQRSLVGQPDRSRDHAEVIIPWPGSGVLPCRGSRRAGQDLRLVSQAHRASAGGQRARFALGHRHQLI